MRCTRILAASLALGFFMACGDCSACPDSNRYPPSYQDGVQSITGGAIPDGARAADDFYLSGGNGNNYNVRVIKFVMIANFPLTPSNVSMTIYSDFVPPSNPSDAHPGAVAAGAPNSPPTVRDMNVVFGTATDGRLLRVYEVSYAIPTGFLQLQSGRWYWLCPFATAPSGPPYADIAYAMTSGAPGIVGQPAYKSDGVHPTGAFTTWISSNTCCIGTHDLAMYLDAVQIGRSAADFDCDTSVSVADIFGYLGAWFGGLPSSDFNGHDGTNVSDLFDFLGAWFAGT